jgi:tetratricopeptide (TPR) repeat protein
MLFQRRIKEGYDNFYGNVPEFLGKPGDVDGLMIDSKMAFGNFLDTVFKYMLIFGRLEDSLRLYDTMELSIDKLPDLFKRRFIYKKKLMDSVKEEFGKENRTVLVDLFRELLLKKKEDRQDAMLDYEQSLGTIYNAFANAHFQLGNIKKGVEFLSAAADTDKKNLALQLRVAEHFFKLKAGGAAIKHYKRVVALEPGRVHEYNKLGFLYYQKGDLTTAEKYFQKAIKAKPTVVASYINIAAVLMARNKIEAAKAFCRKGLSYESDNRDLKEMYKQLESR